MKHFSCSDRAFQSLTRCALGVGLLLAAVLAAEPAGAQDSQAMSMMDRQVEGNASFPTDPAALRRIHSYGRCVAGGFGNTAFQNLPGSSKDYERLAGVARYSSCGDQPLNFPLFIVRGIVAEYAVEHPTNAEWNLRRKLRIYAVPAPAALAKAPASVRAGVTFVELGTCVARANPEGVFTLLRTDVATSEEKAALAGLTPFLGDCLPPGISMRMHPMKLRGYLAEGLYRSRVELAEQQSKARR